MNTTFAEMFDLRSPIASAPMGGSAGGQLAAAVSNAGALGLVGGGTGDLDWLDRELSIVVRGTSRPWGVGLLSWATELGAVDKALSYQPSAVMFSFGDPTPFVDAVRETTAALILQVTGIEEARHAIALGADVIVAQGHEAGGHGAVDGEPARSFLHDVLGLVNGVPVLAAGGIATGSALARALQDGASGALVGTRFQATPEARVKPEIQQRIVAARGADTARSRVTDILRESAWPERYSARTIVDPFTAQWLGRETELEAELATSPTLRREYELAIARAEVTSPPAWASSAIDDITEVVPAAEIVEQMTRQALS